NQAVGGSGPRGTAASGGAIFNGIYQAGQGLNAILSVSRSTFTDNQALGGSGLSDSGGFALGGALSEKGAATLVLSQSTLIRNQAMAGGGVGGNGANGGGGGISSQLGAHLTVRHCTLADNQAIGGDAGFGGTGGLGSGGGITIGFNAAT